MSDDLKDNEKVEQLSECCGERAHEARSSSGWWFEGRIVYQWFECSFCKQRCDTMPVPSNDYIFNNKEENQ